jgi:hypothetical protein
VIKMQFLFFLHLHEGPPRFKQKCQTSKENIQLLRKYETSSLVIFLSGIRRKAYSSSGFEMNLK